VSIFCDVVDDEECTVVAIYSLHHQVLAKGD
jgi:hypothetical protein